MSQDSLMTNLHRTGVPSHTVDPAARTGKRAFNALTSSSVGIELGLSVAIGLFIGYYLDQWLGTQPWLMLLWLVFGFIAGFRGVMRAVRQADRAAASDAGAVTKEGGSGGNA
jgi:ATP synthase protein I